VSAPAAQVMQAASDVILNDAFNEYLGTTGSMKKAQKKTGWECGEFTEQIVDLGTPGNLMGNYYTLKQKTVDQYKQVVPEINFWTTVNTLNVNDIDNILEYANSVKIDHSWAFLVSPDELNIKYTNTYTSRAKDKIKNTKSEI
jgi:hypothetical protein